MTFVEEILELGRDPVSNEASLTAGLESIVGGGALLSFLTSIDQSRRTDLFSRSHETSSHFKWLVASIENPPRRLWIHEFKSEAMRTPGYAEVAHDHRYPFVSRILVGGYTHNKWRVDPGGLHKLGSDVLRAGCHFAIVPDEVHSLSEVEENTLTVVVEGPPVRDFSVSYDLETGSIRTHRDYSARFAALLRGLARSV